MTLLIDIACRHINRGSYEFLRRHDIPTHGKYRYLFVFLIMAVLQISPINVWAVDGGYQIEITKSKRELKVKQDGRVIKKYTIAYGKGHGATKRQIGDNNTPTGKYRIIQFKPDSKFFFFMQLDYPNLLDAWYGYKDKIISSVEFKNIVMAFKNNELPPQHTPLGGYIGIHGLGEVNDEILKIHRINNWTEGCIALKNEEISELRRYVSIGTPITIRP